MRFGNKKESPGIFFKDINNLSGVLRCSSDLLSLHFGKFGFGKGTVHYARQGDHR